MSTDFFAQPIYVGNGVWRTSADHRTKRHRVQYFALLFTRAHVGG